MDLQAQATFCLFPTSLGTCAIAWRSNVVIATRLPGSRPDLTERILAKRSGGKKSNPPDAVLRAVEAIQSLLDGEKTDLSFIDCDMTTVGPFARRVYNATRAIPVGQTTTYGAIAEKLGDKGLSQLTGQALGRNPFPVIVPCHRVIGANGKLTGFSAPGGVNTKLKMLEIEGAAVGGHGGLFNDLPLAVRPE